MTTRTRLDKQKLARQSISKDVLVCPRMNERVSKKLDSYKERRRIPSSTLLSSPTRVREGFIWSPVYMLIE